MPDGSDQRNVMPGGIAFSAALHVVVAAVAVLGLPELFHEPPPPEMPIAVQLVMVAPDTRATQPNPHRPQPDAKPDRPVAAPAPKPEPKPEPPPPAPAPPPSAAAAPPPPAPPPPKPEAKAPPAPPPPPPPPPKPVEARKPPVPPPLPERKPIPKPEPPAKQLARAETKREPKPDPKPREIKQPEARKVEPAAFSKLLKDLEEKEEKKDEPDSFDSLLKNLTKHQVAKSEEERPPIPRRVAALSPPSSQPRAPLGSQLTASEIDMVREQLRPCFNPPFGAKENRDLVADISVAMNPDGTVRQVRILDTGRYGGDPVFRALADSGVRALRNPRCSPLRLPADRYELWKTFIFGVSTKDME